MRWLNASSRPGLGAFELATVALGERLGLYRALSDGGPATADSLADTTGIDGRYAREWCEQQAAAGLLTVDDPEQAPGDRRFGLLPGSEVVLLDPDSPAYLIPIGGFLEAVGRMLPAIEAAYRTGSGISYGEYAVQHSQGRFNRPAFIRQLVQEWLPQIPDLDARLRNGGTVAEFGSGEGWAAIALARGYPRLRVDGFDIDPPSVETARRNAEQAGLADRVRHAVADVTDPALTGSYDAVFAFEMLHDLAHPVAALQTARRLTGDGAAPVLIVDDRAAEVSTAPDDPVQRFFYAASVLHCLPVGRCAEESAADRHPHASRHAARLRREGRIHDSDRAADPDRHVPLLPAGGPMGTETTNTATRGAAHRLGGRHAPPTTRCHLAGLRAMADRAADWARGRRWADTPARHPAWSWPTRCRRACSSTSRPCPRTPSTPASRAGGRRLLRRRAPVRARHPAPDRGPAAGRAGPGRASAVPGAGRRGHGARTARDPARRGRIGHSPARRWPDR